MTSTTIPSEPATGSPGLATGLVSAELPLAPAPTPRVAANTTVVDRPYRSLLKAISWRATGTVDTILLAWLVTNHVGKALSIGGLELFTKTLLYYGHERVWNRLKLGRKIVPLPEYEL